MVLHYVVSRDCHARGGVGSVRQYPLCISQFGAEGQVYALVGAVPVQSLPCKLHLLHALVYRYCPCGAQSHRAISRVSWTASVLVVLSIVLSFLWGFATSQKISSGSAVANIPKYTPPSGS